LQSIIFKYFYIPLIYSKNFRKEIIHKVTYKLILFAIIYIRNQANICNTSLLYIYIRILLVYILRFPGLSRITCLRLIRHFAEYECKTIDYPINSRRLHFWYCNSILRYRRDISVYYCRECRRKYVSDN
jgi:hypothetical protein